MYVGSCFCFYYTQLYTIYIHIKAIHHHKAKIISKIMEIRNVIYICIHMVYNERNRTHLLIVLI